MLIDHQRCKSRLTFSFTLGIICCANWRAEGEALAQGKALSSSLPPPTPVINCWRSPLRVGKVISLESQWITPTAAGTLHRPGNCPPLGWATDSDTLRRLEKLLAAVCHEGV